jgi:hypothetical protein
MVNRRLDKVIIEKLNKLFFNDVRAVKLERVRPAGHTV